MLATTSSIPIVLKVLARKIIQGKKVKDIYFKNEEIKQSPLIDDMFLYIYNPKKTNKNVLEPINKFSNCWKKLKAT